ncbi:LPS-assembly protein LptD, partial [Rhodospirillum rubrum]
PVGLEGPDVYGGAFTGGVFAGLASPPKTATPAPSQPAGPAEDHTLVTADDMSQDSDLGTVTARGNVSVVSGGQTLRADVVTFNTAQNMVTASGNVSITKLGEGPADTTFAQYMELTGDLKDGFVRGVQTLMTNGGRMSALYGERDSKAQTKEFSRGVYTVCKSCPGADYPLPTVTGNREGTRQPPPIWQLKAARITHDEAAKDIIYRDAWVEVMGIPILYTPYISQPDPTVYRRSGFLPPLTGTSSNLGASIKIPYYVAWDDQSDSNLALQYSDKQNVILWGSYDRILRDGAFEFDGSLNPFDEDNSLQGHYESAGAYHLNSTWRAGFESALASKAGYLRRMSLKPQNNSDYLTTNAYLENFSDRSHGLVQGYYFQDTTLDIDQATVPYVPLMAEYQFVSNPLWADGHAEVDLHGMTLRRTEGTDSSRMIGRVGYELPFQDGLGSAFVARTSLRGDFYNAEDLELDDGTIHSGNEGRFVPQGSLIWRYPLVRPGKTYRQVIEPKVGVFAALPSNNPDKIPNEDSETINLDIANLFEPSRLPGYDRVEGGEWVAYSLRYGLYGPTDDTLEFEVGQSYRAQRDNDLFPKGSGLSDNLSDVVARLRYAPSSLLALQYSTQINSETFEPRRHEVEASAGTSLVRGSLGYLYAQSSSTAAGEDIASRKQIWGGLSYRLSQNWFLTGTHTYDLTRGATLATKASVSYEDECLILATTFEEDNTDAYGVDGGTTLMFTVTLKTLGSYSLE